jgi:hypothetical protein
MAEVEHSGQEGRADKEQKPKSGDLSGFRFEERNKFA